MSSPLDPSKTSAAEAEQTIAPSLEEQFHDFWQKNGTRVLIFCAAVAAGIAAVYGYKAYQASVDAGIGEKYAAAETTAQLQSFISANPGHQLAGVAQLRIADEAYTAGKYADAAAAYDKASTMLPAGPFGTRAKLGGAMGRIAAGRVAEGEDILKKLSADSALPAPVRAEATYQLFALSQAAGKTEDAAKYSDQLLQLAPSSPWAQRAMAMRATASGAVAAPATGVAPAPTIQLAPAAK
jgi:hypothetical protein